MTRLIILLTSLILFSCQEPKTSNKLEKVHNAAKNVNTVADTAMWDRLKNSTVLSFLDKVINNRIDNKPLNFITIEDDGTSNNWIKPQDVDTLIAIIKSKKHCKCVVDPLSSYLPTNDYAELGGYAILLLKQYKEKKDIRFSLYACPKANEKDANELIKWWTQNKR